MNKRILISILFSVLLLSLHGQNNYGVEEANTKFSLKQGVLGGSDNFNYLSLDDHPDASGVPLGGIGVGKIIAFATRIINIFGSIFTDVRQI